MATIKLKNQILSDFSGGYCSEQGYITEDRVSFIGDSKNIDIFATEHNDGYGFKKTLTTITKVAEMVTVITKVAEMVTVIIV